jgi:hypothetical protein
MKDTLQTTTSFRNSCPVPNSFSPASTDIRPSSACSRRNFLRTGGLLCALCASHPLDAFSQDFWNKKDPGEWTHEEIEKLTTDSPWAKPVKAEIPLLSNQRAQQRGRYSSGQSTRPTDEQLSPKFQGVILWASAQPILDALHSKIPPAFAEYYVISVSGLPIFSGEADTGGEKEADTYEALKEVTILQAHGKDVVHPGLIHPDKGAGGGLLFGFFKRFVELDNEKQVTFSTTVGPMEAKAKFNLKEMIYHGQLAL